MKKFIIETLDLGDLVRDMVHMLEVSISKKALLRYNFAADLPLVEVDATETLFTRPRNRQTEDYITGRFG